MFPSWERLLYFHLEAALLDGMVSLAGVLLLFRIFRVRNPSVRLLFLFIPLLRPLLVMIEGAADLEHLSLGKGIVLGARLPDPFHMLPVDVVGQANLSTISRTVALLIAAALIAGLIFLIVRWVSYILFYSRLRQRSVEIDNDIRVAVEAEVLSLSNDMGISRPPDLLFLVESGWATPCAIGWRRPVLVIDSGLIGQLLSEELRAILAHELGHVARRDGLWHWISVLLRDVQSFNPFSHLSNTRIELEREKACDRLAVEDALVPPRLLASCLVKLSRLLASDYRPLPTYSMGMLDKNRSLMESRISFLLGMEKGFVGTKPPGRKGGKARIAGLAILCLPLTLVQIYACVWIGSFALVIK